MSNANLNALQHVSFHLSQKSLLSLDNVLHVDKDGLNVGRPHPLVQQHAFGDSLGNALLQKKLRI